ncbi:MAG: Glyoxalase-like domain protein [candidate division WS6 bacterium OLB20]|uniref:Glyoxalase-like domain protein n=1 Tax=candidate division WS6 bacterium OLB20 TaxID=1617426 RepID=A0A136M150_9BACT|nr:MAG: Glyoxalase-like domain protein [candidate division WS6 bacterium OLB20]
MLADAPVHPSFSSNDLDAAKTFYSDRLGLKVIHEGDGFLVLATPGGQFMVYHKDNHKPATFTVLNFEVDDIREAASALAEAGIVFEQYEEFGTDKLGISEMGDTRMAWFTDPAGNIHALMQKV